MKKSLVLANCHGPRSHSFLVDLDFSSGDRVKIGSLSGFAPGTTNSSGNLGNRTE
jgi:hypothetical protein